MPRKPRIKYWVLRNAGGYLRMPGGVVKFKTALDAALSTYPGNLFKPVPIRYGEKGPE